MKQMRFFTLHYMLTYSVQSFVELALLTIAAGLAFWLNNNMALRLIAESLAATLYAPFGPVLRYIFVIDDVGPMRIVLAVLTVLTVIPALPPSVTSEGNRASYAVVATLHPDPPLYLAVAVMHLWVAAAVFRSCQTLTVLFRAFAHGSVHILLRHSIVAASQFDAVGCLISLYFVLLFLGRTPYCRTPAEHVASFTLSAVWSFTIDCPPRFPIYGALVAATGLVGAYLLLCTGLLRISARGKLSCEVHSCAGTAAASTGAPGAEDLGFFVDFVRRDFLAP